MADDRFSPESTVYKPFDAEYGKSKDWDGITVHEYFRRAFQAGKESHHLVQKLRGFFPRIYSRVEKAVKS